ncbi:uncharacterized protein LOC122511595 [Leptopilina heterotoma]|uniref:uncharacterized protein LOC122511595 n=1 Tax=Leptopilina heterotoma TaxID=63436 RepID=UPI001CA9FF01|nr:uncharacterized protein LOC122511595 [Leptopilina heterotoma]XP_043482886.1 uncharacterized protein LOC122511595 [Leptopilina heterotoma]
MTKLLLIFVLIVIVNSYLVSAESKQEIKCSRGYCRTTDECCEGLVCLFYAAKCVSKRSILEDRRFIIS